MFLRICINKLNKKIKKENTKHMERSNLKINKKKHSVHFLIY